MRKPQTRRPPHTRRLPVERNSLPSCYMNFGSSTQMMYYATPLSKFKRFLDEYPDFVCVLSVPVAAQAVATAEAKGKVKGATVTCPNRLYSCYRVTRQAFWGCVHSSVTCMDITCKAMPETLQSIPEPARTPRIRVSTYPGERWIAQQQTTNILSPFVLQGGDGSSTKQCHWSCHKDCQCHQDGIDEGVRLRMCAFLVIV